MSEMNPHGLATPFPSPTEIICDDCGKLIKHRAPALFNAAQELVHWDCTKIAGEESGRSQMQQYADLGKSYVAHAERYPEDHNGRSMNYAEAAKYFSLASKATPGV